MNTNNSPQKSFGLSAILIVLFLVLISVVSGACLGVAFFAPMIYEIPTPASNVVVKTTLPTAVPTVDPTANWKTYANEKYGFEFKYPNNWVSSPGANVNQIIFSDNGGIMNGGLGAFLNIGIYDFCSINDLFSTGNANAKFGICEKSSNLIINNYPTIKFFYNSPPNTPAESLYKIGFAIQKGEVFFIFDIESLEQKQLDKSLLDQILSTFKFTQ